MTSEVIPRLLPAMGSLREKPFNVFDVMHHGRHEKQLSNVFAWLLEKDGNHHLGETFQAMFISAVNKGLVSEEPFGAGPYVVRQEVNTASAGEPADIADLVLESEAAVLVVENYVTSDGHGHSFEHYRTFSEREGRRGSVVLLCQEPDASVQTAGWENASVVTYSELVDQLHGEVGRDPQYRLTHPDVYSFIDQMHRTYTRGKARMEDREVLDFIEAMCATGEARRYQEKAQDLAAEKFAYDLAEVGKDRFVEGREVLQRVKGALKSYSERELRQQLNATLGDGFVTKTSANYAGIFQWTVNFDIAREEGSEGEAALQLKFGPSAWYANEVDDTWRNVVSKGDVDYSHIFVTRVKSRTVRQSAVKLHEVLDGISPDDRRLHDEIVALLRTGT